MMPGTAGIDANEKQPHALLAIWQKKRKKEKEQTKEGEKEKKRLQFFGPKSFLDIPGAEKEETWQIKQKTNRRERERPRIV